MADSPFQEIAALLRDDAGTFRLSAGNPALPDSWHLRMAAQHDAAASTLDRYAEVLADLPSDPDLSPGYLAVCVAFVARLRALSSPLTETTDNG